MPAIRNACVARGQISTVGTTVVYTVPADHVFLLKSLLTDGQGSATADAMWQLYPVEGGLRMQIHAAVVPNNTIDAWFPWMALNAGDQLVVSLDAEPIGYWVSGALLPFNPAL